MGLGRSCSYRTLQARPGTLDINLVLNAVPAGLLRLTVKYQPSEAGAAFKEAIASVEMRAQLRLELLEATLQCMRNAQRVDAKSKPSIAQ